jgi:hypothetical protein
MLCPRTVYTDLIGLWLLATFGEAGIMSTPRWETEKLPYRNDAVFPPLL